MLDQAIIVSVDLVAVRPGVLDRIREGKTAAGGIRRRQALHECHAHPQRSGDRGGALHSAGKWRDEAGGYVEFLAQRVGEAIVQSWQKRRPGKVGWGQGQAVVAQNRRAVYADGTAQMYGPTNTPDFRGIEGYEDHNLECLFFWDEQDRLIATAIIAAAPAQEAEEAFRSLPTTGTRCGSVCVRSMARICSCSAGLVRRGIRRRGLNTARRPTSGCESSAA